MTNSKLVKGVLHWAVWRDQWYMVDIKNDIVDVWWYMLDEVVDEWRDSARNPCHGWSAMLYYPWRRA